MGVEEPGVEEVPVSFFDDPHPDYRRWRELAGGAHRVRILGEAPLEGWVVTGHADCRAALADPRLSKNAATEVFDRRDGSEEGPGPGRALTAHMLNSDPPAHTRLRRLVQQAFTARRVAALRPVVEGHVRRLLDEMEGRGPAVDLVRDFAVPLPLAVVFDLLGASEGADGILKAWAATLSGEEGDGEVSVDTAEALVGHIRALIDHKRARPGDDLLTALIAARDEGDRLSEQEITSMGFLLVAAGHQTTANLISNGVHALLTHPRELAALRADPAGRTGPFIEEALRHESPFSIATMRYTTQPVTIGGTTVPAGEFVQVSMLSANRDPAVFADPDRFDSSRPTAGHLAFGHGIHHRLGAPLARLQAEIAFGALLARYPALRPAAPGARPLWWRNPRHRGLRTLPVLLG
ncbi:cytochrome P450 family protein [Streptomyces lavendulae]|uniref:cytochrome P450 family protein n=1 Tax=Streptomyces lavendulae TaxID=1914 RepID=UPI0024A43CB2|nr:cytochrome P450 [Streptomyces lavendulae]GLX18841.1 cytochrome P450 [Streptomyces lavendulae subsp. lavendulae]GLX29237.1 cytochrome P450 [Streptomyces lavendulae subsp. lavendulae]